MTELSLLGRHGSAPPGSWESPVIAQAHDGKKEIAPNWD
jgi:hypothetical protein